MENLELNNKDYKILEKIGKGGFSNTYLAYNNKLNKKCVIKQLKLEISNSEKEVEFFKKEAKVLSNLNHNLIPGFIDFFIEIIDSKNNIYLVQEYIEGNNLFELIKSGKHFYESQIIRVAYDLAGILEYIHKFSPPIIHRDIKPQNIIMTKTGKVYLIDFGAVRDKSLHYEMKSQGLSTIIGTQGYMPIEQFEGKALPTSDIYSLGMTLIFLLSHKEPYEIEKQKLKFNFRKYINISEEFAQILDLMIEPAWEDRIQTSTELKNKLKELIQKRNKKPRKNNRKILFYSLLIPIILSASIYSYYTFTSNKEKYEDKISKDEIQSKSDKISDTAKENTNKSETKDSNNKEKNINITNETTKNVPKISNKEENKIKEDEVKSKEIQKQTNTNSLYDRYEYKLSYKGNCYNLSANFRCLRFKDNYTVLVKEQTRRVNIDNKVDVFQGEDLKYYHILNTNYFKVEYKTFLEKIALDTYKLQFANSNFTNPPIVVSNSDHFVLGWDNNDSDSSGIFFQIYNNEGYPIGKEIRANQTITGRQNKADMAINKNGDLLVSWESYGQDGSQNGIYFSIFDKFGNIKINELRANSNTQNDQTKPAVSLNDKGNFIIAWKHNDRDGRKIYLKKYFTNNQTAKIFLVFSTKYSEELNYDVAMNNDGNIIIVWDSIYGDEKGIYFQLFKSNLEPISKAVKVNDNDIGNKTYPSVSLNDKGEFIISWQSYGQDESYWGIYAKKYDIHAKPVSKEFIVNTIKIESQEHPNTKIDTNGNFVITWKSNFNNKSSFHFQKFDTKGNKLGKEKIIGYTDTKFDYVYKSNSPFTKVNNKYLFTWKNSYRELYLKFIDN